MSLHSQAKSSLSVKRLQWMTSCGPIDGRDHYPHEALVTASYESDGKSNTPLSAQIAIDYTKSASSHCLNHASFRITVSEDSLLVVNEVHQF